MEILGFIKVFMDYSATNKNWVENIITIKLCTERFFSVSRSYKKSNQVIEEDAFVLYISCHNLF